MIISGRKPLKLSLCLSIFDMLMSPFLSHIPTPAPGSLVFWLPDSSHEGICQWSKVARRMQKKKEEKFLEGVWFGKLLKGLYLISHNLPSITNMLHYNLHSSGVKWRLLSWLPTPPRTSVPATFTSCYLYRNTRRDQNPHAWWLCFN